MNRCPTCGTNHTVGILHWFDQGPEHPNDVLTCPRKHSAVRWQWERNAEENLSSEHWAAQMDADREYIDEQTNGEYPYK